jgi:hypothetical protein
MGYKRKILEARKISRKRKHFVIPTVRYSALRRQCLTKVAYPTEKAVIDKIGVIAEEGRRSLRYYMCPFCKLWHLTHKANDGQKFVS